MFHFVLFKPLDISSLLHDQENGIQIDLPSSPHYLNKWLISYRSRVQVDVGSDVISGLTVTVVG